MISRELNPREAEILRMIRPTTFQDMVEEVRKEVEQSRYNAKRELRDLKNVNGNGEGNGENRNGIGDGCEIKDKNNGNGSEKVLIGECV